MQREQDFSITGRASHKIHAGTHTPADPRLPAAGVVLFLRAQAALTLFNQACSKSRACRTSITPVRCIARRRHDT